jgi:hypothetical protein
MTSDDADKIADLQRQLDELKRAIAKPEAPVVTSWIPPSSLRLMDGLSMPRSTMQDFVNGVSEKTMREIKNDRAPRFGDPLASTDKIKEG